MVFWGQNIVALSGFCKRQEHPTRPLSAYTASNRVALSQAKTQPPKSFAGPGSLVEAKGLIYCDDLTVSQLPHERSIKEAAYIHCPRWKAKCSQANDTRSGPKVCLEGLLFQHPHPHPHLSLLEALPRQAICRSLVLHSPFLSLIPNSQCHRSQPFPQDHLNYTFFNLTIQLPRPKNPTKPLPASKPLSPRCSDMRKSGAMATLPIWCLTINLHAPFPCS